MTGIQDDDGVVGHAQRRGCVDPVALPAGLAQFRIHFRGVVAALTGNDHVHGLQLIDILRVLERLDILADIRPLAAHVRRREEHRLDQIEILLFLHPAHQDRTHHTAPTDKTDS